MQHQAPGDGQFGGGANSSDDSEHGLLFSLSPSVKKAPGLLSVSVQTASDIPKPAPGKYRLRELADLDELTATHITEEGPKVYWEDTHARFRFETLNEALEAMRDPLIQGFLPGERLASAVIEEVREFPPYSACFVTAWKIIEKFADLPFSLDRKSELWVARFGEYQSPAVISPTVAICIAGLRVKGIDVHLPEAI
jgi:hypothetical protein